MIQNFLKSIDPFIVLCFSLHDIASNFLVKHLFLVKRVLLVVAHLSLLGLFYPEFRKDFGSMAAVILFGILFLSPLSQLFRARLLLQLMGLRRELGILMGYFALVHGVAYFLDPRWLSIFTVTFEKNGFFALPPYLLFGFFAVILTIPLLITSNNLMIKYLGGKNWKRLHRLVYVLFVAVVLHQFLIRGTRGGTVLNSLLQPMALIALYAFVKFVAWKNFVAPLREVIAYVSERYTMYTLTKKR